MIVFLAAMSATLPAVSLCLGNGVFWHGLPPMREARGYAGIVGLAPDILMVTGGCAENADTRDNTEVLRVGADTEWSITSRLKVARAGFGLASVGNSKAVAIGGYTDLAPPNEPWEGCQVTDPKKRLDIASAEVYFYNETTVGNETDGEWVWELIPAMTSSRAFHSVARLSNDTVLVAGGVASNGAPLETCEVLSFHDSDHQQSRWLKAASMNVARWNFGLAAGDGYALAASWDDTEELLVQAELYDVEGDAWTEVRPCNFSALVDTPEAHNISSLGDIRIAPMFANDGFDNGLRFGNTQKNDSGFNSTMMFVMYGGPVTAYYSVQEDVWIACDCCLNGEKNCIGDNFTRGTAIAILDPNIIAVAGAITGQSDANYVSEKDVAYFTLNLGAGCVEPGPNPDPDSDKIQVKYLYIGGGVLGGVIFLSVVAVLVQRRISANRTRKLAEKVGVNSDASAMPQPPSRIVSGERPVESSPLLE